MVTKTTETPVLDLIKEMTASSIEASTLDEKELMLVRIAALVAIDAPPASYLVNLGAATELEIELEDVRGILAAIAPIVGTPRRERDRQHHARAGVCDRARGARGGVRNLEVASSHESPADGPLRRVFGFFGRRCRLVLEVRPCLPCGRV